MPSRSEPYLVNGAGKRGGAEGKQKEKLAMVSKSGRGMLTLQAILYPKGNHLHESLLVPTEPRGTEGEDLYRQDCLPKIDAR